MAITVTCANCGKALQAKDEWAGKSVRCPACKEVIKVPSLKAGGPPPMPAKAPVKRPRDEEEIEEDQPVARRRRDEEEDDAPVRKKKKRGGGGDGGDLSEIKEFSPIVLVLLSLVCGLVPLIYIPMLHGKLPKERDNDPGFGLALIFLLVPVLNMFYGMWFVMRRLSLRINEQREKYGLASDLGDPLIWMILLFIPCANIVGVVMYIIWLFQMQTKVNELVQAANG